MKKALALLLSSVLLLTTACVKFDFNFSNNKDKSNEETIEFWEEDSPAMKSIVAFVKEVCDEKSDKYVPAEKRVAVFDSDGTLYGELFPTYFDQCLMMHRLLRDSSYTPNEADRAFAQALETALVNGEKAPSADRSTGQITTETFKGYTLQAYCDYIREFMKEPANGFEGMTYGQGAYKPMVALVKYLVDHDFMVYIVSGAETNLLRVLWEEELGDYIPPYRYVGSTINLVATNQGDKAPRDYNWTEEDDMILGGDMIYKTLKIGKVERIIDAIGIVPTLAFGNSSGDFSMGAYATRNGGKAYMLLCDDTERDHGKPETAEKFAAECEKWGFETVSMKDEFATIYGDNVKMVPFTAQEQALQPAA